MILGYLMVTYFGVKYDAIPLNDPIFLTILSIPMSFNILIIILLYTIFTRISTIIKLTDIQNFCSLSTFNIKRRINLVMLLNDKINDSILSVNNCYIINVLVAFLNITALYIFMTFLLYDTVVHELTTPNFILFMGGYSYCCCFGASCIAIIYFSTSIRKSHDCTIINFFRMHFYLRNIKICTKVHLATLQLYHFQKEISCGLFGFNWKLLMVAIASVFNYVIVMIQFEKVISKSN